MVRRAPAQLPVTSGVVLSETQVPEPQVAPGTQCVPAPQGLGQSGMQVSPCAAEQQ